MKDGKKLKALGSGFFCEIDDKNIPFRKALFTNNHILDKNRIKKNQNIEFEYCGKKRAIKIIGNRKAFTNEELYRNFSYR